MSLGRWQCLNGFENPNQSETILKSTERMSKYLVLDTIVSNIEKSSMSGHGDGPIVALDLQSVDNDNISCSTPPPPPVVKKIRIQNFNKYVLYTKYDYSI